MTTVIAPVDPGWLALREQADADARSGELVEELRRHLAERTGEPLVVHDLGCGTGSMARWLVPQLPTPRQHWVMHDHDLELAQQAVASAPSAEARVGSLDRVSPADLGGASLVTASALLDVLTAAEIDGLVAAVTGRGCPALFSLSVLGLVELYPADPLDIQVQQAFNDHQRRDAAGRTLLGPHGLCHAQRAFVARGYRVLIRPTPWMLGDGDEALIQDWFTGWLDAACEQRPELHSLTADYRSARAAQLDEGRLHVTVHHADLLALPR